MPTSIDITTQTIKVKGGVLDMPEAERLRDELAYLIRFNRAMGYCCPPEMG